MCNPADAVDLKIKKKNDMFYCAQKKANQFLTGIYLWFFF